MSFFSIPQLIYRRSSLFKKQPITYKLIKDERKILTLGAEEILICLIIGKKDKNGSRIRFVKFVITFTGNDLK